MELISLIGAQTSLLSSFILASKRYLLFIVLVLSVFPIHFGSIFSFKAIISKDLSRELFTPLVYSELLTQTIDESLVE